MRLVDAVVEDPGTSAGRFDRLAIAAFTTSMNGGLMPQARQGGIGVFSFAAEGSKFEGIGFEKEHMGQIHVALVGIFGVREEKDLLDTPESVAVSPLGVPRDVRCEDENCLAAFG